MKFCKLGVHTWIYTRDNTLRTCNKCQKSQEKLENGTWKDIRIQPSVKPQAEYCQCPRDYTIAIKSQTCPRCGLPRPMR